MNSEVLFPLIFYFSALNNSIGHKGTHLLYFLPSSTSFTLKSVKTSLYLDFKYSKSNVLKFEGFLTLSCSKHSVSPLLSTAVHFSVKRILLS